MKRTICAKFCEPRWTKQPQGHSPPLLLQDGGCIQKVDNSEQRVYVDPEVCKQCNACLICPGIELGADGVPVVNNLCTGCGGMRAGLCAILSDRCVAAH